MKPTSLHLSERDIGIVLRCLMDAENDIRNDVNWIRNNGMSDKARDSRNLKQADRIRAIRKVIKEQRIRL